MGVHPDVKYACDNACRECVRIQNKSMSLRPAAETRPDVRPTASGPLRLNQVLAAGTAALAYSEKDEANEIGAMIKGAIILGHNFGPFSPTTFVQEFNSMFAKLTPEQRQLWYNTGHHAGVILRLMLAALVGSKFFITKAMWDPIGDTIFEYKKAAGLA